MRAMCNFVQFPALPGPVKRRGMMRRGWSGMARSKGFEPPTF
jgi:hypothetical protein